MATGQFKIGILKIGCIASSPFIDLILDERADRDISTRSWSTGAKMNEDSAADVTRLLVDYSPNLAIVASPNAALQGPTQARNLLTEASIPFISISDGPSRKAFFKKDKEGKTEALVGKQEGFIIVTPDPMIGARREFLDAVEMVSFNAGVLTVLSACGVIRALQRIIDQVIEAMAKGMSPEMPQLVLDPEHAIEYAEFSNPYARAKGLAALQIVEDTAKVTSTACFKEQNPSKYIIQAASGHEMIRAAARLADEAREIEKAGDSLVRTPHAKNGKILTKSKLDEKPK